MLRARRSIEVILQRWCTSAVCLEKENVCSLMDRGCQGRRMVHFYEIFSKEKREQGRKRLQQEMKKGHFDDFKQLRDTQGKLFQGSPGLLPISSRSARFPRAHVVDGKDEYVGVTEVFGSPKTAVLLCAGCREGAQPMIDAWAKPFDDWFSNDRWDQKEKKREASSVGIVEMSVVDSFVMSRWPFRSYLCSKQAGFESKYSGVDARTVFLFGGYNGFQEVLDMFENRLIGYVYLLDREGRIRWRGCGFPNVPEEMEYLLRATDALLNE